MSSPRTYSRYEYTAVHTSSTVLYVRIYSDTSANDCKTALVPCFFSGLLPTGQTRTGKSKQDYMGDQEPNQEQPVLGCVRELLLSDVPAHILG